MRSDAPTTSDGKASDDVQRQPSALDFLRDVVTIVRAVRVALRPKLRQIERAMNIAAPKLKAGLVLLAQLAPVIEKMNEELESLRDGGPPELNEVFIESGFIVPEWFTFPDIIDLLRVRREHGLTAAATRLDELLDQLFTADEFLRHLRSSWQKSSILGPRWPLLREALEAFDCGMHGSCTAVLVTQAEGLVADLVGHEGKMVTSEYRQYVRTTLGQHGHFGYLVIDLYVRLLEGFEHGDDPPDFSRHAIAHGGDHQYGTVRNARRAILLVDAIGRCAEGK